MADIFPGDLCATFPKVMAMLTETICVNREGHFTDWNGNSIRAPAGEHAVIVAVIRRGHGGVYKVAFIMTPAALGWDVEETWNLLERGDDVSG